MSGHNTAWLSKKLVNQQYSSEKGKYAKFLLYLLFMRCCLFYYEAALFAEIFSGNSNLDGLGICLLGVSLLRSPWYWIVLTFVFSRA